MVERASWAVSDADGIITVEDARVFAGASYVHTGSTVAESRSGWLPGQTSPGLVTASATPDTNVHTAPFQRITQSARGRGVYVQTVDSSVTTDVLGNAPADSTNDRHDLIVAQQSDAYYGDANSDFVIRHVVGTASTTPSDPTVDGSEDYYRLARVRVTAGATTIDDADIDDLRPPELTVAAGGTLPVADSTARNDITTPHGGQLVYRLDTDRIEHYTGAAWRTPSVPAVEALANIDSPYTGQLVLLLDDHVVYRWDGSAWMDGMPAGGDTAATRHEALYYRLSTQAVAQAAWQRVHLPEATYTSDDVTTAAVDGGTEFTLQRAGVWIVDGAFRFVAADSGLRSATLASDPGIERFDQESSHQAATNEVWGTNLSCVQRFAAGDTISMWAWQNVQSSLDLDAAYNGTRLSLTWLHG